MAEYVQQRVEAYVPILEHILSVGLLDTNRVNFLSGRIYNFEYKIQSQKRTADDVLGYANYMADMILEFGNIRKGTQNFKKTKDIECEIKHKIYSLLGTYTRDFRADIHYWNGAMRVLLKLKSKGMLNKLMESYVRELGPINKVAWRQAVEYFYASSDGGPLEGIKIARIYMLRAVRGFRRDLQVYIWGMDLELKHENFLYSLELEQNEATADLDLSKERKNCMRFALSYYTSAKESCWAKGCTVYLYQQFFTLMDLKKYPRCNALRNVLARDLLANCSSEEETYELMAELKEGEKSDISEAICYLDKGLNATPTMKMYDIAVRMLMSWLKTAKSISKKKNVQVVQDLYNRVLAILQQGHNNDMLSSENYARWIEVQMLWRPEQVNVLPAEPEIAVNCRNKEQPTEDKNKIKAELESIVNVGLKKYPDNEKLKALRLRISALTSTSKTLAMLEVASAGLADFNNQFYDFILMHESLLNKPAWTLDGKFKKSLESTLNMKDHPHREKLLQQKIKSVYLQGFGEFMTKKGNPLAGLENARQMFEAIKGVANYYSLYKTMARIEFANIDRSDPQPLKRVRTVMETAVLHFGSSEIELWQDYIGFERQLNNTRQVTELEARAKKLLRKDLVDGFQRMA